MPRPLPTAATCQPRNPAAAPGRRLRRAARLVAAGLLAVSGTAPGAPSPADTPAASVFAAPQADMAVQRLMREVMGLAASGRLDEARTRLETALERKAVPTALGRYNLACLHCAGHDTDAALDALAAAVAAGFDDVRTLANDPDLQPLRGLPRFQELGLDVMERAQEAQRQRREQGPLPTPRPVTDGIAEVAEENTLWVPPLGRFMVAHEFPPADPAAEISKQPGPVGDLLRQWRKEGTAAGLRGVLYDNCDEDHSTMNYLWFPELARIEYSPAAKQAATEMHGVGDLHRGLQLIFVHNGPVIGNASVAQTQGPYWRSMSRLGTANGATAALLADQYANNMLYFYPEHRDHDPEADKGHGDVYPANTPYLITSQGSSGSDRAFMNAVAATIAAFRPETQKLLVDKRLLMPTVQMILRAARKPVVGREEYLSGLAHPPVFDGATLDEERMVRMAHDMEPGAVPPLVVLRVVEEDLGRPGSDYFDVDEAEKLFDTVSAVARVARSAREQRRMVVSVADTQDPNGRPLSFTWRLLRGDPQRVRITPLDPLGTRAEIVVGWHPRAVHLGGDLPCARVDVGVFADNGAHLSAPGLLSWYFPPHEQRTYEFVPPGVAADRKDPINGLGLRRIVSIERLPATGPQHYTDPLVLTPAVWTDTYRYSDRGDLLGWRRSRPDGTEEDFTADGRLVVQRDDAGEPVKTSAVRYVREQQGPHTPPVLRQVPAP